MKKLIKYIVDYILFVIIYTVYYYMKFYMIYSNQFAIGNKPIGIASLAAVLKKAGHQFRLFDCTKYSVFKPNEKFTDWNLQGEKTLAFISTSNKERMPIREKVTYDQLTDKVLADIDSYKQI